jgi:outer membrane lipase/esterase
MSMLLGAGAKPALDGEDEMKHGAKTLCLALLAATALSAPAHAQNFYAFGDSLVDNGNTPREFGIKYPPPPYYDYHFSNGPVWAEYFPGLTGLSFVPSNDYGFGGAFSGPLTILGVTFNNLENLPEPVSEGFATPLPSFATEVRQFTATGQHFGPGDVVGVWVGANDYFATLALVEFGLANGNTAIPAAIQLVAQQTTSGVNDLVNLGARRFVVFGLPDLGLTPQFNTDSATTIAEANEISQAHNATLAQFMAGEHDATGANIIVINTQQLFSELLADPAAYGKTNTTDACIDTPSCVDGSTAAQNRYVFWDTVHPTTGTHLLIAEFAAADLNGLAGLTVPAQISALGSDAFGGMLAARLGALRAGASGFDLDVPDQGYVGTIGGGDPQVGKLSGFFSGAYDFGSRNTRNADSGFSYNVGTFALGLDDRLAPGVAVGAALGYGTDHGSVDQGGSISANAYQLGLYATLFQPDYFMNVKFDYGFDDFNDSRPGVQTAVGAKPSGDTYGFGVDGGFLLHAGPATFGPIAGIDITHANIGSFTESGDPALTQSVQAQNYDRVVADAGLAGSTSLPLGGLLLRPEASATVDDVLSGNGGNFSSDFTDEPGVPLTSVYPAGEKYFGVLSGGVAAAVSARLSVAANFSTTVGRSDGEDHEVSGTVRYSF